MPQAERVNSSAVGESRPAQPRPLRSELVYAPRQAPKPHPHVFDWARTKEQRAQNPRVETKHLPRSNTFSQRRKITLGSVGPLLRFVTIATLFAVAGTWFQLSAFRKNAAEKEAEPPKTANRETLPASKTIDRPLPTPTAVGPVNAPTEGGSSMRVGAVRDPAGYARLRGDILPVPAMTNDLSASITAADAHPTALPRVRTAEPNAMDARLVKQSPVAANRASDQRQSMTATNNSTESQRSTTPEVASLPGFVEPQRGTQSR